MGFIEFDGRRYWDHRAIQPLKLHDNKKIKLLASDSSNRPDLQLLAMMAIAPASKAKEELE